MIPQDIFYCRTEKEFQRKTLEIFHLQARKNPVYKKYIGQLGVDPEKVRSINQVPFLPIEFFKTHKVVTKPGGRGREPEVFLSSGTTGMERSKHYVSDIKLYESSFMKCFDRVYGNVKQYSILAFLPSYYENKHSSLLYMVHELIRKSKKKESRFYEIHEQVILIERLRKLIAGKKKIILFGVSYALLDLAIGSPLPAKKSSTGLIVIETGGMKGRRVEIVREELHKILRKKFNVKKVHSEYGMTELLSQAYSKGDGIFNCPPWMKALARDVNDPFSLLPPGQTGALNIIDLANIHSCSFIATQDIGRIRKNGSFEVLGRMDHSDLRGCNLLVD